MNETKSLRGARSTRSQPSDPSPPGAAADVAERPLVGEAGAPRSTLERLCEYMESSKDGSSVLVPHSFLLRLAVELAMVEVNKQLGEICESCRKRLAATHWQGFALCGSCAVGLWDSV